MKKIIIIWITILIFLVSLVYGQKVYVENEDVYVSSNQNFYCEPIFNSDGCLVKAFVDIYPYKNLGKTSIKIKYKDKIDIEYKDKETKFKDVNKTDKSKAEKEFFKDIPVRVYFEFFTSEDGKFDVVLGEELTPLIVLDPYYNVSINSSYPSYYLIDGQNHVFNNLQYDSLVEISSGLSDDLSATKYEIGDFSSLIIGFNTFSYEFDELSGTVAKDSGDSNDGTYHNTPKLTITGVSETGARFNGIDEYVSINGSYFQVNSTESIMICFSINVSTNLSDGDPIIDFDAGYDGFFIEGYEDGEIRMNIDRSASGNVGISTVSGFDDSQWHTVCFDSSPTVQRVWVDGVLEDTDLESATGSLSTIPSTLYIARSQDGGDYFTGSLDEVCFMIGQGHNASALASAYDDQKSCHVFSQNGNAISAYFNHTINGSHNYYLMIEKENQGLQEMNLYLYQNATEINQTLFLQDNIMTGYDAIDLTGFLPDGYNEPIRLFTSDLSNISELYLLEEIEDTVSPIIYGCALNDTLIGLGDVLRISCNVTDNEILTSVYFDWIDNITNYEAVDRIYGTNTFIKDLSYSHETDFDGELYTFVSVNATDIVGLKSGLGVGLSFTYLNCIPDWNSYYNSISSCQVNDTFYAMKLYNDTNNCGLTDGLPVDNGTIEPFFCDYCTPLWIQRSGEDYECKPDDSQFVFYDDWNSCCLATGLYSDCYSQPSDHNTTINCTFDAVVVDESLELVCDDEPILKKKMYCYAKLNQSGNYKCISYVRQYDNLLQTNPLYVDRGESSFIDIVKSDAWGFQQDTRESFTPQNGLVNFYFTNKNVIAYTDYTLGVICAEEGGLTVQSEMSIQPVYEDLNRLPARTVWTKNNLPYFFVFFFIFIVVLMLVLWVRNK